MDRCGYFKICAGASGATGFINKCRDRLHINFSFEPKILDNEKWPLYKGLVNHFSYTFAVFKMKPVVTKDKSK